MTGRERTVLTFAVVVSLVAHGALAYSVMDLRLTTSPDSALFRAQQRMEERSSASITRSLEDVVVRQEPEEAEAEAIEPEPPVDDPEALREQAERLLENVDLSDALELDDDLSAAVADVSAGLELGGAEPVHRPASAPAPGPAELVDASDRLLAMADPVLALPEFVETEDDLPPAPELDAFDEPAEPRPAVAADGLDDLEALFASDPADAAGEQAAPGADERAEAGDEGYEEEDDFDPFAALQAPPPTSRGGSPGSRGSGGSGGGAGVGPGGGVPDLTNTLLSAPAGPGVGGGGEAGQAGTVHLDSDFVYSLRVTHEYPRPRGLFDLLTPEEQEESWFEVRVTPRQSLRRLEPLHKDVVWAIDTSSSVSPWYISQVRSGVQQALRTLNEGDRFNIVLFAGHVNALSEDGLLEATERNIDRAREFLADARAGGGGVDPNRALSRLLVRDVPADRVYQIILLSDGVATRGNITPTNLAETVTRENDGVAAIYAIGIGDEPDRSLLELLTYRNKGSVIYPRNPQHTAASVLELATRLRYPVVRDATFSAAGVDGRRMHPQRRRDIYMGEPLSLFGRFGDDTRRVSMQISGTNREQTLDLTFTLDFSRAAEGDESIPRNWGFWKLQDLHHQATRDESERLRREMEQVRERYRLP